VTKLCVVALGLLPTLATEGPPPAQAAATPTERRRAFLGFEHGWADTDVYRGATLRPGHRIQGPLIVEEETTTVFVGPQDLLEIDAAGNYLIHLVSAGEGAQ
jgi:N-methylhydantoinase A